MSAEKTGEAAKRDRYTEAYIEHYPHVFNTVFTKVGNPDDTGDLCQEIFLIFYEKFEEVENHRKWLFGTMRNVVLRYYERKSKTPLDIDEVFSDAALTFVNGMRETRLMLAEVLEQVNLDEEEKLILDYIAFSNYSYGNVGEIMGLTRRKVGYKYLGVVRKVVEKLKERGIQSIEDLL